MAGEYFKMNVTTHHGSQILDQLCTRGNLLVRASRWA
mgnify:CR=1 FL=1